MGGSTQGVSQVCMGLGDGVNEGVHYRVEQEHRQGVSLVHSDLQVEGICLPGINGHDSCEVLVQVVSHIDHCLRSMVVLQGETDKIMVDATECVCQVEPADAEGLVLSAGIVEGGQEFKMVFCASWYSINKCLLHSCVEVVVPHHVGHPSLFQQAGEYLTNAGCQDNGPKVVWFAGIILSLLLPQ